LTTVDIIVIS